MDADIQQRVVVSQVFGQAVCVAMRTALLEQGFKDGNNLVADFLAAEFNLNTDPYDGTISLKGVWQQPPGNITLHPDGMVYAEVDIIRVHPQRPQWFVEAVIAWGKIDSIKTELRLLKMLTE